MIIKKQYLLIETNTDGGILILFFRMFYLKVISKVITKNVLIVAFFLLNS